MGPPRLGPGTGWGPLICLTARHEEATKGPETLPIPVLRNGLRALGIAERGAARGFDRIRIRLRECGLQRRTATRGLGDPVLREPTAPDLVQNRRHGRAALGPDHARAARDVA